MKSLVNAGDANYGIRTSATPFEFRGRLGVLVVIVLVMVVVVGATQAAGQATEQAPVAKIRGLEQHPPC